MNVLADERHLGCSSIKRFIFQFSQRSAVNRICDIRSKILDVKTVGAGPDFFIRSDSDFDFAVLDFRMIRQVFDCRYDFGHAGFVVGT